MDYDEIKEIKSREEIDEEFAALDLLNTGNYYPRYDTEHSCIDEGYIDELDQRGPFYMDFYEEDCGTDYDEKSDIEMDGGFAGLGIDYGDMGDFDGGW